MSLRISAKIFTATFLIINLSFCNGQVNTTSIRKEESPAAGELSIRKEDPEPMIFPNFTNQIAETVRVMFLRVWFVGWGGAFRFQNGEILNITKDGPW
jgi:hypothetical protein